MSLCEKTLISEAKGYGMIATATIPPGGLIISETPLFRIPSSLPLSILNKLVMQSVSKLPKDKQSAFLSLRNAQVKPPSEVPPFLSICSTNGIALGVKATETGIFDLCSRFNHSCLPNAHHAWSFKHQVMEFRALREIPEGTEITINYLSDKLFLEPHTIRQGFLQEQYGFLCQCDGCVGMGAKTSDSQRAEISKLSDEVGDGRLIALNPARALAHCKRLTHLASQIHMELELCRIYYDAFQVAVAHGDLARASAFMQLNIKYRKLFEGEDAEDLKPERTVWVERPQTHRLSEQISRRWKSPLSARRVIGNEGFEEWLWARAER